ncbi:hypothetical protein OQA88_8180 [Cercophora sp. LCS_1]
MADEEAKIDQQFADELREAAIRQLKDRIATELHRECDAHDKTIKEAWDTIQRAMSTFDRRRRIIFATLRTVEGEDRARQVIGPDMENITPPSYHAIFERLGCRSDAGNRRCIETPLATPIAECAPSFEASTEKPSLSLSTSATGEPVKKLGLMAKRTSANNSPMTARKKPKMTSPTPSFVRTENADVSSRDVDGEEFIFAYPSLGPGWFVLRCDKTKFSVNPLAGIAGFQESPAIDHFQNDKTCRGHDARSYTMDEIIRLYGHRAPVRYSVGRTQGDYEMVGDVDFKTVEDAHDHDL